MPLLKKIGQMKKEGLQDDEISQRLREEGASLRQIDEAIDQSKVKSAVAAPSPETSTSPTPGPGVQELPQSYPQTAPMQPSQSTQQISQEMQPSSQELPEEEIPTKTEQPQYQEYGTQPEYEEYQYAQPVNTEIVIETAEQIINEKTKDIQKQITEFLRFKTETQGKINNIDDRLKRIEMIIDRLQMSIMQKIGTYDKNIADLKKEMITTQDSFSKVLNPLSEHIEELRKITNPGPTTRTETKQAGKQKAKSKTTKKKTTISTKKQTKNSDGFENYLRS